MYNNLANPRLRCLESAGRRTDQLWGPDVETPLSAALWPARYTRAEWGVGGPCARFNHPSSRRFSLGRRVAFVDTPSRTHTALSSPPALRLAISPSFYLSPFCPSLSLSPFFVRGPPTLHFPLLRFHRSAGSERRRGEGGGSYHYHRRETHHPWQKDSPRRSTLARSRRPSAVHAFGLRIL